MGKINWNKIKSVTKNWRVGDYLRQFSIVAGGVIVTFWGSDLIMERAQQKEVRATMQLVIEELEHNQSELYRIGGLLSIDVHMAQLLREKNMEISDIPEDTLRKYNKFFSNMDYFNYSTDALDVLKGSSLMQYVDNKRLLQDILQIYYYLGRIQKDISDYYTLKSGVMMEITTTTKREEVLRDGRSYKDDVLNLLKHDKFVNYTMMVPGFLDWGNLNSLDEKLSKQIQTLKEKYD